MFLLNQLLIMLLMTIVVAVSFKIVGLLLITSLLIIPAASRQHLLIPENMAIISSALAVLAVIIGIYSSLYLDTPSGPSIVVASTIIFIFVSIFSFISKKILKAKQQKINC